MGLLTKRKIADVPETKRPASVNDTKKLRLNKPLSKETISAMASDTLRSGGWRPEPNIGDEMPDGTVLAGISPDTNKPMYATPANASLTMPFNEAQEYAAKLDAHGHKDWRVPTEAELNVLFNNRAAIGGFNVSGSDPVGWYWSASPNYEWCAWGQRVSDVYRTNLTKDIHSAVRCVR